MLDGIDLEDKENVASVTSVIKAVLDGVKVGPLQIEEMLWMGFSTSSCCVVIRALKLATLSFSEQELVKLTIEKQEHPSPTSPNKPALPATTAER